MLPSFLQDAGLVICAGLVIRFQKILRAFLRRALRRACGSRTIEHGGAGGAELRFVLREALRHAAHIRDRILAKPKRIRRAGVCIGLCIGEGRRGSRDRDEQGHSAELKHDVALQFTSHGDKHWSGKMFLKVMPQIVKSAAFRGNNHGIPAHDPLFV